MPIVSHLKISRLIFTAIAVLTITADSHAQGVPLIVSANDGLNELADGGYRVRDGASHGSLAGFDASQFPPKKLWEVPADHSVVGPPAGVALSIDGRFAFVSNPSTVDPANPGHLLAPAELQIFDLTKAPAAMINRVPLPERPWGVAINRAGTLLLAASGKGAVFALRLNGGAVLSSSTIDIGTDTSRVMSVAITPDGQWALASKRGEDTVAVLKIDGDDVVYTKHDITVGSNPYSVAISPDGRLAAVTDIGRSSGDADAVSIIELEHQPFRAINVLSVAATPEAATFSPNSKYLAVGSINGSNLSHSRPGYSSSSRIQIFDASSDSFRLLSTVEDGPNAQGLLFLPDSRHLLAQEFTYGRIAIFNIDDMGLRRNQNAIPLEAAPSAITGSYP